MALYACVHKQVHLPFLIGRLPASDTLNTWRGVFEPSVKAHREDEAKRNRACVLRPARERHIKEGVINQISLMTPSKLCCPLDYTSYFLQISY